jgi:hypothetical protein
VKVSVEAGVQPEVVKSKRPWGNATPEGAVPAGGERGCPVTGMNSAFEYVHVAPPPVKLAVMVPEPVALGPLKVREATLAVEAEALLLPGIGSGVVELALAVLLTVVPALPGPARATSVKAAAAPEASVVMLQLTVPPAPTAGLVQMNVGPDVCANDTNVVPAGSASVSVADCAALGPLFVRTML